LDEIKEGVLRVLQRAICCGVPSADAVFEAMGRPGRVTVER
jgi:hypothetical protein